MRLGISWDVPPKSWLLPIPVPDPRNGEDALTKGSENVGASFIRLAISVVGMP